MGGVGNCDVIVVHACRIKRIVNTDMGISLNGASRWENHSINVGLAFFTFLLFFC